MKFYDNPTKTTLELPYGVSLTQQGWGTTLAAFATEAEAIEFAKYQWQVDHDHQDFTRGGDERAEWSVTRDSFDEEGELADSDTLWSAKADERL